MAGNSFGTLFKVTTFGESHGVAMGAVVDGVPPGLDLSQKDIQIELDRRRPGQSQITTQRQEGDVVEILSGVFEGKTTGCPIGLLIRNSDANPKDYNNLKDLFRPNHADFTFFKKFGLRDYRGGGRSSGRETSMRVAVGAIAKKILAGYGIKIFAYTKSIAGITAEKIDLTKIESNAVRCPDVKKAQEMIALIEQVMKEKDSVGGIIEVVVKGCPAGLGDPVFDKLDAKFGHALLSIGAIKGFEVGDGFASTLLKGSENNDEFCIEKGKIRTRTNHSGGILGGISNGEDIILRVGVKPTATILKVQKTVNTKLKEVEIEIAGRHDPCIVPRAIPVVEAMIALVLIDAILIQKTINSKVFE